MNCTDTVLRAPTESHEPEAFGKYQVQYKLGQGAMGAVYKAYDPSIDRMVAIKTISKEISLTDETGEFKERFLREVRATGKINHPNIISIFDSGELDGTPFFVMEYVEGKELREHLVENTSMSLGQATRIFCQILDALSYSHKCEIVHRDIKPSNIFIDVNGNVKIADFGIAKQSNSNLTQTGSIIGTPSYMSPEQCQGKEVDHRSDLFSAAVMFYEMITGEKCFGGSSTHIVMHRILNNAPEKPSILNVNIPENIDRAVLKALSKSPADRFSSALEFKEAIEGVAAAAGAGKSGKGKSTASRAVIISGVLVSVIAAIAVAAYLIIDKASESSLVNTQALTKWQQAEVKTAPLSDQSKVLRLLKVAKAHELVGRYIVPEGSNAYATYQIVLQMDPGNTVALEGIQRVKEDLLEQIEGLVEQGEITLAKDNIEAAITLYPTEGRFKDMQVALN